MKVKKVSAATCAAAMCFSLNAVAQSSVTLFGVVDNGITYATNVKGASQVAMQDGIQRSNKLGFQGEEDLGDGKSAIFRLVSGFSLNTGASSSSGMIFKEAFVGLRDRNFGDLTFGRQYDFLSGMSKYIACLECGIYAIENADLNRFAGDYLNNSIKYQSAIFHGFSFGGMYSFGDDATGFTNTGRAYSFSVRYENGPFSAGLVHEDINGSPLAANTIGVPIVLGVNTAKTPSFNVDTRRITAAGVSYAFGNLTLAGMYSNTRLVRGRNAATDQLFGFGANYLITPATLISAMETYEQFDGAHWYTTSAGVSYSLSKSTRTYVDFVYQNASDKAVASVFKIGTSSNKNQAVVRVGVIHNF